MALFTDANLGGLRVRTQFRLQNDPRFTDAMVNLALNKAVIRLMIFIRNSLSIMKANTFVLQGGTYAGKFAMEYPMPPGTLWVDSLSFDGQQPLRVMSQDELANTGIETSNGIGDPYGAFYWFNNAGLMFVTIYPRPGRVAVLEFYGGIAPAPMVLDTDTPPYGELYFDTLESYAVSYLTKGMEGLEAKADAAKEDWKEERAEAKFNQTLNRVYKTKRLRDIP